MNHKEILKSIKELVGLAKQETVKEIDVVEEVVLSTDEAVEKVIEEVIEEVVLSTDEVIAEVSEEVVELAEDAKEEPKKEVSPEAIVGFATQEELSQVKQELLSMIKALIEDKSSTKEADVPAELSAIEKEAVELSEEVVEEIVHSPESVTEQKKNLFSNKKPMTTAQRVAWMINN